MVEIDYIKQKNEQGRDVGKPVSTLANQDFSIAVNKSANYQGELLYNVILYTVYWILDVLWVIVVFEVNNIAIHSKVVRKNVHTKIPKNNMEYDTAAVEPTFFHLPLALAKIPPLPIKPFFQISLKKHVLKTTHNNFRDCRVHFFR